MGKINSGVAVESPEPEIADEVVAKDEGGIPF